MQKIKKIVALSLVLMLIFTTFSIVVLAAGQTTVTLEKGKELEYATGYGWSTSRLTADGGLTYCIMPDKPVPPDGKYSTSDNNLKKLTSSNTDNYTWFTKALYYGYGGDGFNTKLSAFTTNSSNHQVVNKDGTCKAFMDNLKYSQYGFEMLEPNGSDLWYLLTHRVLSYISGYSNWDKNLPSTDWESAIIELANAIKKAPTVPVTTELYVMDLGSSYQQVILQKDVIQLQLQKTSADTEITNGNSCYSLEGAEYSIYLDKACTEYFGKMTTDEKGFAKYGKNVPYQNYYIKETKAPKGYALDETVYSFKSATTEEKNGITIYTYKVKDNPINDPIGILLNKIDKETGEASTALANAEFTIKYYDGYYDTAEALETVAHTRSWTMATNEQGAIFYSPHFLVTGDEFYYNEFNQVTIPLGTITIQETKAPEGYKINPEVFIRQIKTDSVAGIVTTYNPPVIEEEQVAKGKVQIIKTDSLTNRGLANVKFGLYSSNEVDSNGLLLESNLIETLVTAKDGTAVSSDLTTGTYYLQELEALKYYQYDDTIYTVEITEDLSTKEIKIENHLQTGKATVKKVSEDNYIEGIEFQLYGYTHTGQQIRRTATTNKDGIADFGEVPVGNYTISEITDEVRYLSTNNQTVKVTENSETVLTFENILKKGDIDIVKTSEDDKVDNLYFNVSSQYKDYGNFKTDIDGNISIDNLPVYDIDNNKIEYTITELGELQENGTYKIPDRYNTPKSQTITLDYNKTTTVTFNNTLKVGNVTIEKQDENGNQLNGAEFTLYSSGGRAIKVTQNGSGSYLYTDSGTNTSLSTNSSGKLVIYNLPQGEYFLRETKAPTGYMPYGEKIEFTISASSTDVSLKPVISVKDSKLLLYDTGGSGNNIFYFIGGFVLLFNLAVILLAIKIYRNKTVNNK